MTPQSLPPTKIGPTTYADYFYRPGQTYGTVNMPCIDITEKVQAHVVTLRMPPAIRGLALFGEPGIGKSHTLVNAVTSISNTAAMLLPSSIFGSKHEGGLVQNFKAALDDAVAYSAFYKQFVAVILDDIDASELSISENTGHTTSSHTFAGFLQTLLTSPQLYVDFTGKPLAILFSANDATKIRPSLFRDDRVTRIIMTLDPEVRDQMVYKAFAPQGPKENRIIERLLRAFSDQNMSFWSALVKDWKTYQVQAVIRQHGPDQAALERLRTTRSPLDASVLNALAATRRDSTIQNHFKPSRKGLFA
jgi:hypothetical protein